MDSLQERLQPALSCLDVGVQEGKHLQLRKVQNYKHKIKQCICEVVYLALGFHHPNHPCPHQACSLGLSDKSHLLNEDEIGNEDDFDKVSY